MSVTKWSPLKELEDMRRDMDRLFEEVLTPRRRRWLTKSDGGVVFPAVELYDRKNEIVFRAELPGVEKEDIDLSITKDTITLKGEVKRAEEVKEEDYYSDERSYGTFNRTVSLPVEVDNEKAKATFKNGILELVIPKREEARPKEIRIEVS